MCRLYSEEELPPEFKLFIPTTPATRGERDNLRTADAGDINQPSSSSEEIVVEEVLESAVDESGSEQALPSEEVLVVTEISEEETNGVQNEVAKNDDVLATEEGKGGTELPAQQQTVAVSS